MDPQKEIKDFAAQMQADRFKWFGGIALMLLGTAFRIDEFLDYAGTLEARIIKGDAVALAASTAFADTEITIPGRDDAHRMVVAVRGVLDAGAATAADGVQAQLNKLGKIEWKRSTGRSVPEAFRAYSLGMNEQEVGYSEASGTGTPTVLSGSARDLLNIMAPQGIDKAMLGAIDVLKPSKNLVGEFKGLNGVTILDSHSAGLNVTPYALVVDAVEGGR